MKTSLAQMLKQGIKWGKQVIKWYAEDIRKYGIKASPPSVYAIIESTDKYVKEHKGTKKGLVTEYFGSPSKELIGKQLKSRDAEAYAFFLPPIIRVAGYMGQGFKIYARAGNKSEEVFIRYALRSGKLVFEKPQKMPALEEMAFKLS